MLPPLGAALGRERLENKGQNGNECGKNCKFRRKSDKEDTGMARFSGEVEMRE